MKMMKKCFTVVVSMAMCAAVMVQPFGDNIRTLKSEVVSYAVDAKNSAAEHYADVVMNKYDTCSDLVDLSVESYPARPVVGSFSFMDIDFDGELEFIVHRREAGTRRGGSAEIFKIDGNNLKSIMRVNDTFIENFEGLYCDENGNKFFIGYKFAGGFGGVAAGLYKMYIKDGQLVEEELFREIDWNAPASGDLYGTHEYHQNGEKIDVTEDEYNTRIEEYKSSLTNLNLSYQQSSSFSSFEEMSDEEKREFFISSYNAFNYDGFQRQDDNTSDDDSINKTWQELYADELRNYMNSNRYSDDAMFDLYDMNDDGIPELIISEGLPTIRECIIYTMYEEKLINLGEYGSYGGVGFNTDKNLLLSLYDHQGYFSYGLYGLSNDAFEHVFSAYNDANAVGEEKATYKINGEIVNAEKYNEELSKYESNNCVWLGRKYTLDEENIKSVLLNGGYEDDNNNNQDKTYGDYTYRVNENDEIVIVKYNGSDENVEIPSEIDGRKVTVISGVEGPADLEYPRIGAFEENSAIKSVVIPDTVTKIEMNSFKACDNLQNVTMSENIQTIEQYAFSDCNLSYVYLPESISDIGDCALGYSGGSVIDDFVIYGFVETAAESYADNNGIIFETRKDDFETVDDYSIDYHINQLRDNKYGFVNSESSELLSGLEEDMYNDQAADLYKFLKGLNDGMSGKYNIDKDMFQQELTVQAILTEILCSEANVTNMGKSLLDGMDKSLNDIMDLISVNLDVLEIEGIVSGDYDVKGELKKVLAIKDRTSSEFINARNTWFEKANHSINMKKLNDKLKLFGYGTELANLVVDDFKDYYTYKSICDGYKAADEYMIEALSFYNVVLSQQWYMKHDLRTQYVMKSYFEYYSKIKEGADGRISNFMTEMVNEDFDQIISETKSFVISRIIEKAIQYACPELYALLKTCKIALDVGLVIWDHTAHMGDRAVAREMFLNSLVFQDAIYYALTDRNNEYSFAYKLINDHDEHALKLYESGFSLYKAIYTVTLTYGKQYREYRAVIHQNIFGDPTTNWIHMEYAKLIALELESLKDWNCHDSIPITEIYSKLEQKYMDCNMYYVACPVNILINNNGNEVLSLTENGVIGKNNDILIADVLYDCEHEYAMKFIVMSDENEMEIIGFDDGIMDFGKATYKNGNIIHATYGENIPITKEAKYKEIIENGITTSLEVDYNDDGTVDDKIGLISNVNNDEIDTVTKNNEGTNIDTSTDNSISESSNNAVSEPSESNKTISTASSPQTGDNITRGIPALVMAVAAMIIFRKRK